MKDQHSQKDISLGILLALTATIIWSGNFVISRSVIHLISPISLAFFRWSFASLLLFPFAWKVFKEDWQVITARPAYFFWTALTGISLFNTCVYIAGHFTSAINMALIGTTSSPIFASLLAFLFLKEKIGLMRMQGMIICIFGILLLLSQGSLDKLMVFHFSKGDLWVLAGAFSFAVYNVLVRRKPTEISSIRFLFIVFFFGAILLIPFFLYELSYAPPIVWNTELISSILYVGIGTSVISFLCWNLALHKLGTARTVIFGNLIPVFSTLEAVWLLGEKVYWIHWISGLIVIIGLVIANLYSSKFSK
jgi:drug/metabolite transporter (DMT)-like permease